MCAKLLIFYSNILQKYTHHNLCYLKRTEYKAPGFEPIGRPIPRAVVWVWLPPSAEEFAVHHHHRYRHVPVTANFFPIPEESCLQLLFRYTIPKGRRLARQAGTVSRAHRRSTSRRSPPKSVRRGRTPTHTSLRHVRRVGDKDGDCARRGWIQRCQGINQPTYPRPKGNLSFHRHDP